jgi:hypothetical protein
MPEATAAIATPVSQLAVILPSSVTKLPQKFGILETLCQMLRVGLPVYLDEFHASFGSAFDLQQNRVIDDEQ